MNNQLEPDTFNVNYWNITPQPQRAEKHKQDEAFIYICAVGFHSLRTNNLRM